MSEFLRSEWDVLLGMLGVTVLGLAMMTGLFSLTGSSWATVLSSPLATLVVVMTFVIWYAVLWWSSRP